MGRVAMATRAERKWSRKTIQTRETPRSEEGRVGKEC